MCEFRFSVVVCLCTPENVWNGRNVDHEHFWRRKCKVHGDVWFLLCFVSRAEVAEIVSVLSALHTLQWSECGFLVWQSHRLPKIRIVSESLSVSVCVCVCVWERERERVCVCVCVCVCTNVWYICMCWHRITLYFYCQLVLIKRTGQEAQCWDCICVRVCACVDVDQCVFLVCQFFDGNEAVLCVCGDVGGGLFIFNFICL